MWGERTNAEIFAYADDVAVIGDAAKQLQQEMEKWNGVLERNGLNVNKDKVEVVHLGRRGEDLKTRHLNKPKTLRI